MASEGTASKEHRDARIEEVTRLVLKGWPLARVAEYQERTPKAVAGDFRVAELRWRAAAANNISFLKQRQLGKLDVIESELWQAWERSCRPSRSTRRRVRRLPSMPPLGEDGEQDRRADAAEDERDLDAESFDLLDGSRGPSVVLERIEHEHSVREEQRDGDPRFIELILRCIQERARITGMYPKEQADDERKAEPVRRVVVYLPESIKPPAVPENNGNRSTIPALDAPKE